MANVPGGRGDTVSGEPRAGRTGAGAAAPFRVGDWTVDPATGVVSRDGTSTQLEPKAAEVLLYLAGRPGEVVSRQELEQSVWQGRVVSYDAVTNTMIKLRRAFEDDARNPRVIQTLSKRGYRLVAPVASATPATEKTATRARPRSPLLLRLGGVALLGIVLAGLAWLAGGPESEPRSAGGGERISIVVLPFDNFTGDPTQEYFSNGLTDDLITELSSIAGFAVIANDSAFVYRGDESLARLREELGVRFVVRGSVRREAGRLRVNARLVDAVDGRHLWAERYDEEIADAFVVQDAIVQRIAASLRVTTAGGAAGALRRRYTAGIQAYDHFLQGKAEYGRRSQENLQAAKESFERAIALDPRFARAYASLALVHLRDVMDGWDADPSVSLRRARVLADRAIALDGSLPEARYVSAAVALFDRRYEAAVAELDRAIAQRPSYADAYATLAWVLHFAGRPEQGREHLQRAISLNPHVTASYLLVEGGAAFTLGDTDRAIAVLERALEISPTHPRIHLWLAAAYVQGGRFEEARWVIEQLLVMHPGIAVSRMDDAFPFKDAGHRDRLVSALRVAGLPD